MRPLGGRGSHALFRVPEGAQGPRGERPFQEAYHREAVNDRVGHAFDPCRSWRIAFSTPAESTLPLNSL